LSQEYKNAPDRLKKAQDRLDEQPFDTEAWGIFIRDYQVGVVFVGGAVHFHFEHFFHYNLIVLIMLIQALH